MERGCEKPDGCPWARCPFVQTLIRQHGFESAKKWMEERAAQEGGGFGELYVRAHGENGAFPIHSPLNIPSVETVGSHGRDRMVPPASCNVARVPRNVSSCASISLGGGRNFFFGPGDNNNSRRDKNCNKNPSVDPDNPKRPDNGKFGEGSRFRPREAKPTKVSAANSHLHPVEGAKCPLQWAYQPLVLGLTQLGHRLKVKNHHPFATWYRVDVVTVPCSLPPFFSHPHR